MEKDRLEYLQQLEREKELRELKDQLPHLYTSLYQWQRDFVESTNRVNLCTSANQPLLLSESIPTPAGYIPNGELRVGDQVFGSDGRVTNVVAVSDVLQEDEYRITFDDGSHIIAGPHHKWICKGNSERFRKDNGHGRPNQRYGEWRVKTTVEMLESGKYAPTTSPSLRHSIPISDPVQFPEKKLVVDPYKLGVLLGDGCMRGGVTLTTADKEIIDVFEADIRTLAVSDRGVYSASICGFGSIMRELGLYDSLSYSKFIPNDYKLGSVQQRKDVLAGLLDTDGCVDKDFMHYSFCTTSERLKNDFVEVLNSLGGVVNRVSERYTKYDKGQKTGRKSYNVSFKTPFNPFRLKRRADKWRQVSKYRHERIIYKIEKTGAKSAMRCISVDNANNSYLASNQYIVTHNSGKSTWMIVRAITLATDKSLWPKFWPRMSAEGRPPSQFWYLYEDRQMVMREFLNKWVKEWLPRGKARYEGPYRWTYVKKDKSIEYVHFLETDVRIYFFSYGQGVDALQASTVYEIFVDEELPFEHYDELSARLTIPRGHFNAGFTATKGQEAWRTAMEEIGKPEETFKSAFKKQVSVWQCMEKEDGSPGLWDEELIQMRLAQCSTHAEVLKRMYGKFVKATGLMVPEFDIKRHFQQGHELNPKAWTIWGGIDAGSGGELAHPAGIVLLAVNDAATKARVIKCWRGDKQNTTHTQIMQKYQELTKGLDVVGTVYDKASRDLFLTASSLGVSLIPANKSREEGFGTLNSLFKHDMLKIYHSGETDETHKLKNELMSYSYGDSKSKTSTPDNLIDPLRYVAMQISWNFDAVIEYSLKLPTESKTVYESERQRVVAMQERGMLRKYEEGEEHDDSLLGELSEWSEYFDDLED